jgi:RNA polymerase sigma factor (sigma-70 family)
LLAFRNCTVSNEDAIYHLREHDGYIKRSIKRHGNESFYNELLAEGRLAVVHALQVFDEAGGASLKTFIKRGIRNAIKNENRMQTKKRRLEDISVPLDEIQHKVSPIFMDNFIYKGYLYEILDKLTPEYREVLVDRFMKNMTVTEIAKKQEVCETRVYNLIQEALCSCRYKYKVKS